jgi:hypothetical protein
VSARVVIRPVKTREFRGGWQQEKTRVTQVSETLQKSKWRRGWDNSRLRRSSFASLRIVAAALRRPKSRDFATPAILTLALRAPGAHPKIAPSDFVEPSRFVHTPCTANKKGPEKQALFCWRRGWDSNPRRRK